MVDSVQLTQILNRVACIVVEREGQHGRAVGTHQRLAKFWSVYLDHEVSATDAAVMLILLKICRIAESVAPPADTFDDLVGYSIIATACFEQTTAFSHENKGGVRESENLTD